MRFLAMAAFFFCCVLGVSQAQEKKRYVDPDKYFEVELPEGWKLIERTKIETVDEGWTSVFGPDKGPGRLIVSTAKAPPSDLPTQTLLECEAAPFFRAGAETLKESFANAKVSSVKKAKFRDREALRQEFSFTLKDNQSRKGIHLAFLSEKKDRLYFVAVMGSPDVLAAAEPIVLKSLVIPGDRKK